MKGPLILRTFVNSNRKYIDIIVVTLIALVPRLFGIQRYFWKDEAISLNTLPIDIFKDPLLFGATTNLPFFFYILKVFHLLFSSESQWIYRVLPLILGVITIIVLFVFLSKAFSRRVAWFAVILMSLSPLQVYYSQELRPYALIQLLLVLNIGFLYLYLLEKRGRAFVFFVITAVLIVFTHYSGYYFLFAEGLLVSVLALVSYVKEKTIEANVIKILGALLASGILMLILLLLMAQNPLFLKSVSLLETGGRWDPFANIFGELTTFLVRMKEVLTNYYWFGLHYYSVDSVVQFVFKKLIAILIAVGGYLVYKNRKSREGKVTISIGFILVVSLVCSYFGEKFGYFPFGGRHIMPFSVFLFVLIAYALSKLKVVGVVVLSVIVFVFLSFQFCFLYKLLPENVFITIPSDIYKTCLERMF